METSEKLNFQDFVDLLAEKTAMSKNETELFLRKLFSLIPETITDEEAVKLKNLGTFKLTLIQSRESVNVNTGEKIKIPAHYRLEFSPASTLKELVNKPFSHFENVLLNEGVSFDGIAENTDTPDFEGEEAMGEIVGNTVIHSVGDKNSETDGIAPPIPEEEKTAEIQISEKEEIKTEKSLSETKKTAAPEVFRLRRKESKSNVKVFIAVGLVAVVAISAFFFLGQKKTNNESRVATNQGLETPTAVAQEIASPTPDSLALVAETPPTATNPTPDTVTLIAGKTLRLIALDKFGSREFWIYIYLKNNDKIKNPNRIPVGTKFLLPDKSEYDIDADNPESVGKAKKLGEEVLKKFGK
ncbi:MAG: HU family DNA-binding protein [Dysgonamonadaceae bacterium]|jgi:nucleoid DNA-binding protein|nr:HU family DNA-binding protein [Dysgonamonadaceae bacterium]